MNTLVLTDTYTVRVQAIETFTKECEALKAFLKDKCAEFVKVIIGMEIAQTRDSNFLLSRIIALNTDNKRCILLQIKDNATMELRVYQLKEPYKNIESIFRSRFFQHPPRAEMTKTITLDVLQTNPLIITSYLEASIPEPVFAEENVPRK